MQLKARVGNNFLENLVSFWVLTTFSNAGQWRKTFRQTEIVNKNLTANYSTCRKETKASSLGIKATVSCFHLHVFYSLTHKWVWKCLGILIPNSFRVSKLLTEALPQVGEKQKSFDNVEGKEPFTLQDLAPDVQDIFLSNGICWYL